MGLGEAYGRYRICSRHSGQPIGIEKLVHEKIRTLVITIRCDLARHSTARFFDLLGTGRGGELSERSYEWIEEHGGNGGQEFRNWLAVAGAAGDRGGEVLVYEPVPPWLTGMGVLQWHLQTLSGVIGS